MSRPVAIEVRDVAKSFRVPAPGREVSLRQRIRHPLSYPSRPLEALRGVSFDVHQGEFFGVIGRNGSGKSTLLKLIAGTYAPSSGRVRVAGRLAPFLELGIGFNPQLPAYDNIVLNGVMMGLSRGEARRRSEEIIDFAGLGEFTDLSLKNYSSGMRARLGFSVMTHVDADILLVDEVLAVGDAEFTERCDVVFKRMHRSGRTIVFVSHSMESIAGYCERAILIEDGRVEALGESVEAINRYLEINLRRLIAGGGDSAAQMQQVADALARPSAHLRDVRILTDDGEPAGELGPSEPLRVRAALELERDLPDAALYYTISEGGKIIAAGFSPELGDEAGSAGARTTAEVEIANRFTPGRYVLGLGVAKISAGGEAELLTKASLTEFRVGGEPRAGSLALEHTVTFSPAGATD